MATAPHAGTNTAPANTQPYGDLTDPTKWMALVNNQTSLTGWLQSLAPKAPPDLVNYYAGAIAKSPGANPTEQAGSAAYWSQKFTSDPKSNSGATVLGGAPATNAGATPPTGGLTIPVGTRPSNGAPIAGTAVPRPGTPGAMQADQANAYQADVLASLRQRQRAQAGGRASTILGGFSGGAPATAPATLLGGT